MANTVTIIRLFLVFVLVALSYRDQPWLRLMCFPLVIVIFLGDAIDGYVARKLNESSQFGAILDITIDRIVENVLWIVLADHKMIPIWIPILFITRGFLVDSVRSTSRSQTPFSMMNSRVGKFLVAGRLMRGFYGATKGAAFSTMFLVYALPGIMPGYLKPWQYILEIAAYILVFLAVLLCLIRGIPVLIEFHLNFRRNNP